jgi:hypothetical protein
MSDSTLLIDILGSGLLNPEIEHAFLEWCIVQTVRPAFAHALTTHNMLAESRQVMAATTAVSVSLIATKAGENARETMFRQLALWIKRATDYSTPRSAWDAAREAAVWSLLFSQRGRDVAAQAEQYQQIDKQIRATHASRLREMAGL